MWNEFEVRVGIINRYQGALWSAIISQDRVALEKLGYVAWQLARRWPDDASQTMGLCAATCRAICPPQTLPTNQPLSRMRRGQGSAAGSGW